VVIPLGRNPWVVAPVVPVVRVRLQHLAMAQRTR